MLIEKPAPFIETFVESLDNALKSIRPEAALTTHQKTWLSFCVTGILLTNSICWSEFQRTFLGKYTVGGLSRMFRQGKTAWNLLLVASVRLILMKYGITGGQLVIDEVDRSRSKSAKRIHKTYKQKDKKTGGCVNGQTIVLLLLVAESVTIPVGFVFYKPDPVLSAWNKKDGKLKKQGVPKKDRPPEPIRDPAYPAKLQLAPRLSYEFAEHHSDIRVTAIMADALYGKGCFTEQASRIFGGVQTISQLRKNQNIFFKGKKRSLEKYFNSTSKGVEEVLIVRGGQEVRATISSARLKVDAHGKKRFVIAIKYDGEEEYRYLVATDLSWRTPDIAQAYTLRWLAEVFFEDWKLCEGWGREARQSDEEGSVRGLILSLLSDHALLLHPEQTARIEDKLPAHTVGSLQRLAQTDSLSELVRSILQHQNPSEELKKMAKVVKELFQLIPSAKHMIGRYSGRLKPTPALQYKI